MIAIIDYDMGNLRSVEKALEHLGASVTRTRDAGKILDADHVVLPGVGAFGECMKNLTQYGLIDPIKKAVSSGKPFLGICLGLQLLFDESEESMDDGDKEPSSSSKNIEGLGIIKGRVLKFKEMTAPDDSKLKIPHMGWNSIIKKKDSPVLKDVADGSYFYFVHSYYAAPEDQSVTLTETEYGITFTSSIAKDNVLACQFHPEKSQDVGLALLKDFIELK